MPTTKAHTVRLLAVAGLVLVATLALLDYQRVFSEVCVGVGARPQDAQRASERVGELTL